MKIKVLEAFGEPISYGGQEAFIMNVLDHLDRSGLEIDFLTPYYCDNDRHAAAVREYGGEVYALGCSFNPGGIRNNTIRPIRDFLRSHSYDVIHIHSGSNSMLAVFSALAAAAGIPRIIVHSHSTGIQGWKHNLSKLLTEPVLRRCPTDYCSCSEEAGIWRFPADICKERLQIIYNGIEVRDFEYDEKRRAEIRASLGLGPDDVVIGNIGRLVYQKNQQFLIEILERLVHDRQKGTGEYRLLLVGGGEDHGRLEALAEELGVSDKVMITGPRNNVSDYYQAIDILAVPSQYEGFGMVVIEGQAAGLDVLVSDRVPRIADVTGAVTFIPIEDRDAWIAAVRSEHLRHPENSIKVADSGFNAEYAAATVRKMYI